MSGIVASQAVAAWSVFHPDGILDTVVELPTDCGRQLCFSVARISISLFVTSARFTMSEEISAGGEDPREASGLFRCASRRSAHRLNAG